jgi:uncharacterized membrane protein
MHAKSNPVRSGHEPGPRKTGFPPAAALGELPTLAVLSLLVPILVLILVGSGPSDAASIIRIVLGIPYLTLFPGYAFTAALFPKRESLTMLERLGFSVGLSLSLTGGSGYFLNYTPWGIRLEPLCVVLSVLILAFCVAAFFRRVRIPPEKRYALSIRIRRPLGVLPGRTELLLWAGFFCALIGTLAVLVYGASVNGPQERYTEFYLLGPDRQLLSSADIISLGESVTVVLGIINHESQTVPYSVLIRDCGSMRQVLNLRLDPEQRWEQTITITPTLVKEDCNVSFLLFREGDTEPYRSLFLWIAVQEPLATAGTSVPIPD